MGKSQKTVKEFALIGFILLAVLFGMQIMTFIFGNLGSADYLDDTVQTVYNESPAYLNATGYTLTHASQSNFSGAAVILAVWNLSSNTIYEVANYSVDSATGVIINGTDGPYSEGEGYAVNVSYTTNHKTEAEMVSDEVTNKSLRAIGGYADQSGTQFTTLGVAITLILLVAVFLFFWKSFMDKAKGGSGPGSF